MQNQTSQSFLKKFIQNYYHLLIAVTVGYLILVVGIMTHKGYIQEVGQYFVNAAMIAPFLVTALAPKRSKFSAAIVGLFLIVIIFFSMNEFWNYQDKPWFSPPETNTCDGKCYGWFSFENDPPWLKVIITGFVSLCVGIVTQSIRLVTLKK
jgi:hypothetical protein